ncbi:MAG: hypothetical protein L6265_12550 [Thermoplasmatales archaeon]|nr:hypothetical protein [Candidatus Thermoplasmatota archaeon]MCG2827412.1 hypothetical protein [Thermoplasmatales archaeon]
MSNRKKVKKISLSEYLKKGDLKKLICFLKNRETVMKRKEKEIQDKIADLDFREAEFKKKTEPIKYKEEELGKREEDMRFREEKLEMEMRKLKGKKLKKITISAGAEEKLKMKEELSRLEEEIKFREEELKRREKYLTMREKEITEQIEETAEKKEKSRKMERECRKIRTGIRRLDDLLFGGIPFGSNVMVYGPSFTGKQVILNRFVTEGLGKDIPCVIITVDKSVADVKEELKEYVSDYDKCEKNGLIRYIDIYSKRMELKCDEQNVEYIKDIKDLDVISLAVNNTLGTLKGDTEGYRMVLPLSTLFTNLNPHDVFNFLEDLTGKCKRDNSVVLYSLTKGLHSETDVQVLRHLMDGVIEFKEENLRTFFSVQGVCDVQTRSWIQYKFTEKELIIGSFSLDRIR